MQIEYMDDSIIVAVKPPRVLSTDEPGGMPDLVRAQLGDEDADVRTVHRLDRVVSGLMLLARSQSVASELSRQIRDGDFDKKYLAAVHGSTEKEGFFDDLMIRDKAERKSYVTDTPGKGVQRAQLKFDTLDRKEGCSLVRVHLITGRTHQIRCQFSHHAFPLIGDRKYSLLEDDCEIALWSESISFTHPVRGERMRFTLAPPDRWPWNMFKIM